MMAIISNSALKLIECYNMKYSFIIHNEFYSLSIHSGKTLCRSSRGEKKL